MKALETAELIIAAVFGLILARIRFRSPQGSRVTPGQTPLPRTLPIYDILRIYDEDEESTPIGERLNSVFGIEEAKRFTKASQFYAANWYTTPDEPRNFQKTVLFSKWDKNSIMLIANEHIAFAFDRNEPGTQTHVIVTDTLGHELFSYDTDTNELLRTVEAIHTFGDVQNQREMITQHFYAEDVEMDEATEQLPAPVLDEILAVPPP